MRRACSVARLFFSRLTESLPSQISRPRIASASDTRSPCSSYAPERSVLSTGQTQHAQLFLSVPPGTSRTLHVRSDSPAKN